MTSYIKLVLVILFALHSTIGRPQPFLEIPDEVIQSQLDACDTVISVHIYKLDWIPPSASKGNGGASKAQMLKTGAVFDCPRGDVRIGERVQLMSLIEDPPALFGFRFSTIIDGELKYILFNSTDATREDKALKIDPGFYLSLPFDDLRVRELITAQTSTGKR